MLSLSNNEKNSIEIQTQIKIESDVIDFYKNELEKSKKEIFDLSNIIRKRNQQYKESIHLNNSLIGKIKKIQDINESNENELKLEIKYLKEQLSNKECIISTLNSQLETISHNFLKSEEENRTLKNEIEKSKTTMIEYENNNLNSNKQIKQLKDEFDTINSKFNNLQFTLFSTNKLIRSDLHGLKVKFLEDINYIQSEYIKIIDQVKTEYEFKIKELKSDLKIAQRPQIKTDLNEKFIIRLLKIENNFLSNKLSFFDEFNNCESNPIKME
jgi:chromosome segregation protein